MFSPSRDQVRQFFCAAWKKHQERMPLVGAEVTAADIAARLARTPEQVFQRSQDLGLRIGRARPN